MNGIQYNLTLIYDRHNGKCGFTMNKKSEEIRIRYLYRDLVIRGKTRLPLDAARKIVGPDCAYHLYSIMKTKDLKKLPVPSNRKKWQ
jgi:hypothetical protein